MEFVGAFVVGWGTMPAAGRRRKEMMSILSACSTLLYSSSPDVNLQAAIYYQSCTQLLSWVHENRCRMRVIMQRMN
jgi:hypothetical protein